MSVAFDGLWHVHYGQLYVESTLGDQHEDMTDHFAGQRSGLLGAAVPGALFLTTGLHTGPVGLRVEILGSQPALDDTWEDVVEASFTARPPVRLVGWGGESEAALDLAAGDHRVRWAGTALDAARDQDTVLDDERVVDRYLLQFWPAERSGDTVLRQSSETAAYWHDWVRSLKP